MPSESHCHLCGTEIVQGSCQNSDCSECSVVFGEEEECGLPLVMLNSAGPLRGLIFSAVREKIPNINDQDIMDIASRIDHRLNSGRLIADAIIDTYLNDNLRSDDDE